LAGLSVILGRIGRTLYQSAILAIHQRSSHACHGHRGL
jgi:hypothetical protein